MDFRRAMKQAPRFQLVVGIAELAITTTGLIVALVAWNTVVLPGAAGRFALMWTLILFAWSGRDWAAWLWACLEFLTAGIALLLCAYSGTRTPMHVEGILISLSIATVFTFFGVGAVYGQLRRASR